MLKYKEMSEEKSALASALQTMSENYRTTQEELNDWDSWYADNFPHGFNEYVTYNNPIKIKGLNNKWIDTGIRDYDKKTGSYAFNYVHKSNINTRWQDSVTGGDTITGLRPDVSFSKKMRSTGPGMIMTSPYYVRCHYLNLWDY